MTHGETMEWAGGAVSTGPRAAATRGTATGQTIAARATAKILLRSSIATPARSRGPGVGRIAQPLGERRIAPKLPLWGNRRFAGSGKQTAERETGRHLPSPITAARDRHHWSGPSCDEPRPAHMRVGPTLSKST